MINRREVMTSGIAVALLAQVSRASLPGAMRPAPANRLVFVADGDVPEAAAAARAAVSLGTVCRTFCSDVTEVYEWLDLYLRESRAIVAGVASLQALFPLERLAWDRGLRTVYRGTYRRDGRSRMLLGSPAITEVVEHVEMDDWPGLGRALARIEPGPADSRHVLTSQHPPGHDDAALVSWLLAPRDQLHPRARPERS